MDGTAERRGYMMGKYSFPNEMTMRQLLEVPRRCLCVLHKAPEILSC